MRDSAFALPDEFGQCWVIQIDGFGVGLLAQFAVKPGFRLGEFRDFANDFQLFVAFLEVVSVAGKDDFAEAASCSTSE